MKIFNDKNCLIFLLISSSLALFGAYVSQYFFDLQPCILCFYQRKPFWLIIAISIASLTFFNKKKSQKIAIILCALLLVINCGISLYHSAVEKKIIQGPSTCLADNLDFDNLEDLKNALTKTKSIRCDEPEFFFLNLSMANWNFIYCLLLLIIVFRTAFVKK